MVGYYRKRKFSYTFSWYNLKIIYKQETVLFAKHKDGKSKQFLRFSVSARL